MNFAHFFIDRPIFAGVISIVITLVGAIALSTLADRAVSRHRAADDPGHGQLSGREREGRRGNRGHADRAAGQWRREHALHVFAEHERRQHDAQRHFQARHQSRYRAGARAKPRRHRHPHAAGRCAAHRRHDEKAVARHHDGRASRFAGRLARLAFHQQLRAAPDPRRARAARRRRRHQCLRRARILDAHLARSEQGRRARAHRAGRRAGDPGAECASRRGHRRRAAGAERRDRISIHRQHAGPARG